MKKVTMLFSGAFILAAVLALASFTTLTEGPSVNGQGSLTNSDNLQRRFAFQANTMPDGSVQGSGVLTITGGEAKIKFDINCMTVTGNTAIMSGVVTSVTGNTAFQEGWNCWFKVVDNGEGENGGVDQITLLSGSPNPLPCNVVTAISNNPLNNVEGGNIQVKL